MLKTLYKLSIHDFKKSSILLSVFRIEIFINYYIILIKMLTNFKSHFIIEYIKKFQ